MTRPARARLRRFAARGRPGHPSRFSPRRWSLRTRLVAAVVVLCTAGMAVTGFAGVTLLRGYLMRQVDQQLTSAGGGAVRLTQRAGDPPPLRRITDRNQVPTPLLFTVLTSSGKVEQRFGGSLRGTASVPDLTGLTLARVRAGGGRPFTVSATDGSVRFRVRATPLPDGTGSFVVAISLRSMEATVDRLRTITLLTASGVLALLLAIGVIAVRLGLRPLTAVERTAKEIADGDLASRVPAGPPGTEIGRLSDTFNDMVAQIESSFAARDRSEETLRQFVADASHELRTPLTTVRGYAELVRRGALPDAAATEHAMRRVEAEATRMGRLVDDLLLLAYLDQRRPLNVDTVDLEALVAEAVADARARDPERPVDVTTPGHAVRVDGDADRLRQVLGNVLGNALMHTPPGTPVHVRLVDTDRRPDAPVRLTISDEGPGVAPDQLGRLFERFYRVDAGRSRAAGGSGLGLSIVQAVVQALGGRVECDSAPGRGTTFVITLPPAVPAEGLTART